MRRSALLALVLVAAAAGVGLWATAAWRPAGDTGQAPAPPRASQTPAAPSDLTATVERLIGQLDEDGDGPLAALVALGPDAVPALAAALGDADDDRRARVVEVLAEMRAPAAVEPLTGLLRDPRSEVRVDAVAALGMTGDRRAVPALHAAYADDPSPQVRYEALTSLGLLADPQSVPLLVEATRSADQYARLWGIDALCVMGAPEAAEAGLRLLDDPSPYVRRRVLRVCGAALTTAAADQRIVALAVHDPDFESTVWARRHLVARLADAAVAAAVAARIRESAAPPLTAGTPATQEQYQAVFLRAELRDGAVVDQLIATLRAPDVLLRQHAVALLGQDGGAASVPGLVAALDDPHELVSGTARAALKARAERGDTAARAALEP